MEMMSGLKNSKIMKKYRVKVRYVFEGCFDIRAENEDEAREIADRDCGLVMGGGIHTSNDGQVCDWDFRMHPENKVLSAKQLNN